MSGWEISINFERGNINGRIMDDLADIRKGKNIYIEKAKKDCQCSPGTLEKLKSWSKLPWRAGAVQSCRPSVSELGTLVLFSSEMQNPSSWLCPSSHFPRKEIRKFFSGESEQSQGKDCYILIFGFLPVLASHPVTQEWSSNWQAPYPYSYTELSTSSLMFLIIR